MEKNDIVKVEITDVTVDGEGIGKVGTFPLFIKDTAVGDVVTCKVMKLKKTYGYARLLEIETPSPDRIPVVCPVARQCGGCQLQHISYGAELRFKTKKVRENLKRIGGFTDLPVEDTIGMEERGLPGATASGPYFYRNKAQVPFGYDRDGKLTAGFYAGRTHDIIDCENCFLTFPEAGNVISAVKDWMTENGVRAYDEASHTGLIRHALIRKAFSNGQVMVCLIVNGEEIPGAEDLINRLRAKVPGFYTMAINENTTPGNVILGRKTWALFGPGCIEDTIGDVRFRISPESFFQVNPVQTRVLYGKALEFAGLTGRETVWDLYCGIGTISLFLARSARKVYGVEIVPRAIDDACENALLNGLNHTEFFVGAAEEVLPRWYAENPGERIDVVMVDPPRKGLDETCIRTILDMAPGRVVYVSCDSATLSRDLRIFADNGYRVEKVQPVDMFPRTVHVESVVLITRKEK